MTPFDLAGLIKFYLLANASGVTTKFASHFSSREVTLLIVAIALVVFSAFLSFAETGLTRMSRIKASAMVEQQRRGAQRLVALLEAPTGFLNPILLLTLVSQLVAATLVGIVSEHIFGGLGVAIATAVEVLIIFVFGEALPKNWAVRRPEEAALFSAPIVVAILKIWPIRAISNLVLGLAKSLSPASKNQYGSAVSEEELLAMADAALEGEVIEGEERELIHSIISFGDTVAREVMVPRPDIVAIAVSEPISSAIKCVLDRGYSRIPVYEDNIDNICGVVFAKDLLKVVVNKETDKSLRKLLRPTHYFPETKPVAELLREMQAGKFHQAVIVDEYGGTAGIVSLEDLIEELVGEIVDEYDQEVPEVQVLEQGGYLVSGSYSIDELSELLDADLPEGDWDTVSGFVLGLLGHLPEEGEIAETEGFLFRADKVTGRRVVSVRVEPRPSDWSEKSDELS